jgi:hypothetical protein
LHFEVIADRQRCAVEGKCERPEGKAHSCLSAKGGCNQGKGNPIGKRDSAWSFGQRVRSECPSPPPHPPLTHLPPLHPPLSGCLRSPRRARWKIQEKSREMFAWLHGKRQTSTLRMLVLLPFHPLLASHRSPPATCPAIPPCQRLPALGTRAVPPLSKFPFLPPLRRGPSVPASGTPMRAPRGSEAWRPRLPLLPCPMKRACVVVDGQEQWSRPPARQVAQDELEKKRFFSSFLAQDRWDRTPPQGKSEIGQVRCQRPFQFVVHARLSARWELQS